MGLVVNVSEEMVRANSNPNRTKRKPRRSGALKSNSVGSSHDSVIGLFPVLNLDANADKNYKCNVAGQYAPRILLVNIVSKQGHHEFPKAISDENRPNGY